MLNTKTSASSLEASAVPVLDLSDFVPARGGAFAQAFGGALRTIGCVAIAGHGVPASAIQAHDAALREWFTSNDPARLSTFAFLKEHGIDRGYLPPHERRSTTMRPGDRLITVDVRIDLVRDGDSTRAIVRSAEDVQEVTLDAPGSQAAASAEVVVNGRPVSLRRRPPDGAGAVEYVVTCPDRKYGWVSGDTCNLYPEEGHSFASLNRRLYEALSEVARALVTALDFEIETRTGGACVHVLRGLCGGDVARPVMNNILRALYYPPGSADTFEGTPSDTRIVRGGAHNDVALMSILTAASVDGLEVLTRDGSWLDVPRSHDLVYVIAGDTMRLVTQDLTGIEGESLVIPPTTHRVTATVETVVQPRSANVLFVNLDMSKPFRSPVTGEIIRYQDAVRNIDVELDPALRLLHARLRANGTLTAADSFEAFAQRASKMPMRMAELAPGVPGAFFLPPLAGASALASRG